MRSRAGGHKAYRAETRIQARRAAGWLRGLQSGGKIANIDVKGFALRVGALCVGAVGQTRFKKSFVLLGFLPLLVCNRCATVARRRLFGLFEAFFRLRVISCGRT